MIRASARGGKRVIMGESIRLVLNAWGRQCIRLARRVGLGLGLGLGLGWSKALVQMAKERRQGQTVEQG